MWCSAAHTHLKLLDRVVSDARFLTGGVFECDIAHRSSVAALCMLYEIRFNLMHPLYGSLTVLYVSAPVARGAVVAHRYILMRLLNAEPLRTAGPLFPSQCPCRTILLTLHVFDGVGLAGFKSRANTFYWP